MSRLLCLVLAGGSGLALALPHDAWVQGTAGTRVEGTEEQPRFILAHPGRQPAALALGDWSAHCPGPPPKAADGVLRLNIPSARCRKHVLGLLEAQPGPYPVPLAFEFGVEALQAQLQELQQVVSRLSPDVTPSYLGATLVLEGSLSRALWPQLALLLFQHSVGRLVLDNRLTWDGPPVAPERIVR